MSNKYYNKLVMAHAPAMKVEQYFKLLNHYESPENIFCQPFNDLIQLGIKPKTAEFLTKPPSFYKDLKWLETADHHLICIDDTDYPQLLKTIPDPPRALYVKGDPSLLWYPQIAIVGPRRASSSGMMNAKMLATKLVQAGFTITSGMAIGVDAVAHKVALELSAPTIAVAATGLDIVYPKSHERLADMISQQGAIVSEYAIGTLPKKYNFPKRNRVISGLSMGVLVVEATKKSGSLITARHAMEQNREVFAIPGSINNPLAKGCHRLIKDGAILVEDENDIISELQSITQYISKQTKRVINKISNLDENKIAKPVNLNDNEELLLEVMEFEPITIDNIAEQSNLTIKTISSSLLNLELMGIIVKNPNGMYVRIK